MQEKKITQKEAESAIDSFIKELGLRRSSLDRLEDQVKRMVSMYKYGEIKITGTTVEYQLEVPFLDVESVKIGGKRYTVKDIQSMASSSDSEDKVFELLGTLTTPNLSIAYLEQSKQDFINLNAICSFFLPN